VDAAVGEIEARLGPVGILVANAGVMRRAPSAEMPPALWREVLATNLDGVFWCCQAVGRRVIARGQGGKIIIVGSVMSELGRPTIAPYVASKGALRSLARMLCAEWARHGIQVNTLAPGYFETELTSALVNDAGFTDWLRRRVPAGRWGRVEELAGAAVFLASSASDFVNGHMLCVDGGLTGAL
jgi:gluconate 5-dehydrogenase